MTAFSSMFVALYKVVSDILLPTGGVANSPVAIVSWFGILTGALSYAVQFLKGLAR